MYDYLFLDNDTGDEFFVECDSLTEAWSTVYENFGEETNIEYLGVYTPKQAEIMGYDTF